MKGCRIHWTRSWRIARLRTKDKARKGLFSSIASQIPNTSARSNPLITFEVLCKKKSADMTKDVNFIDFSTDWLPATKWVEWCMRPQHLKLLHKDYTEVDESIWECCPSDTIAVKRKNLNSKESQPQHI